MNTHVKYIKSSLWLATALYLLIIIASYYPNDISLNTTSTITKVYNIGGTFGAYIADIMMQIFGISSIILCLFFFIMAKKTRDNIQISKKKSLLYVILSTTAATSLMPTVYYFNRIDLFAQKGFMGNLMLKIPQSSYMKIIMLTVSVYCIFKAFGHSIKVPNKIKFVKKQKLQIKIQPVETEGNESTNYPLNIFNNEDEKNNFSSINKSIDSTSMEYSKNKTYQNSKINITHESNDEQNSNKDIDSKPNHESNDEQNSNKDIDSKPNHESNDEQNSNKDKLNYEQHESNDNDFNYDYKSSDEQNSNKDKLNYEQHESNDNDFNHETNDDKITNIDEIYSKPVIDLLDIRELTNLKTAQNGLEQNAQKLESALCDFGIKGSIVNITPGPVVTLYELEPAPGIKSSRIIGLSTDIARALSATSVRIAIIPGKNVMGIEIPNISRQIVSIRSILESDSYVNSAQKLPLALGVTINGENVVADLAKMPHLLIAGTTGSGKSVAINTMIISLIYSLDYNKCKFIMIDPKMLELSLYNDIPHLITPVVTDPKKAVIALKWVVAEMEARYRLMSQLGVRNIDGYNQKIDKSIENNETIRYKTQSGFDESGKPIFKEVIVPAKHMPTIIVIVDEMADLMLLAGKEIESLVQRLAQMARAAGIHIIMATQRPSVDVITGVIKANFPTRISFAVTSKIDSRTILGEQGAESLLGMGDMLYMSSGGKTQRLHGPFISDKEIQAVLNDIKNQAKPCYLSEISTLMESISNNVVNSWDEEDGLYAQAVTIVKRDRKASISYLQRQLKIGFNRAASLIERMEKEGIVSEQNGMGKRTVVIT